MKSPKSKIIKKALKKKVKAEIEIDLGKKIKDFVLSLGHDAEGIAEDIKKASKLLSKKLVSKLKNVKTTINNKLNNASGDVKKVTKKDLNKAKKEVDKVIKKGEANVSGTSQKTKKQNEPVNKQATSINSVSSTLKSPVETVAEIKKILS